jgi:hypothetical protein
MAITHNIKMPVVINTNGEGYWSSAKKQVLVVKLEVVRRELRVYFDTSTWDVDQDSLIYSDPLFMSELKAYLEDGGIDIDDLAYSEHGMQGQDYVSCDVDLAFLETWFYDLDDPYQYN